MSFTGKIAIVCVMLICIVGVSWMATSGHRSLPALTYSQFLDEVRVGRIAGVIVYADGPGAAEASCRLTNGSAMRTVLPADYRDALTIMQQHAVNLEIRDSAAGSVRLLLNASPFFILLAVWLVVLLRGFPNGPGWRLKNLWRS